MTAHRFQKNHTYFPPFRKVVANPVPIIRRPVDSLRRLKQIILDPKSKPADVIEAARVHEAIEARVRTQQIELSKGKTRDELSQSGPQIRVPSEKVDQLIAKLQEKEAS